MRVRTRLTEARGDARRKPATTALRLARKAKRLAVTARDKEGVRRRLAVTAKKLAESYTFLEEKVRARTKDLETEKEKLAEAKARDDAMLASIGDGVITLDPSGRVTFVNQAAQDLLGWSSADIVGRLLSAAVPIEDQGGNPVHAGARPITIELATGLKATASPKEGRPPPADARPGVYYYVRKDKSRFPVAMSLTRAVLRHKVIGAIEVFRDITKEVDLDRAKTEFVSLASHQLRTPLTSVNWYSEMLLAGAAGLHEERRRQYLERIHAGSERMVALVDALLNVSRIELGTLVVEKQPVRVRELLADVISEQMPQADARSVSITDAVSDGLPVADADPKLLRMVFQNLLSNSIKYSPTGGHVEIGIVPHAAGICISVADQGCGIPKKDHGRVFTKMFRADNVKEKGIEGTGLGLYIVKSVLTALGGSVRFESEEDKGTTFFVTLPSRGR